MSNQTSSSKTTIITQTMKERFSETTTTCLHNLIDSAFLDAGEMANDCLEFFDNYQWEPEITLNEADLGRWEALLDKGYEGLLQSVELTEFFSLTDPNGEVHPYYFRVMARELVGYYLSLSEAE